MKNFKRIYVALLVLALLAVAVCCVACDDKPQPKEITELTAPTLAQNQMAVIVKNCDGTYNTVVVTLGENGTTAQNGADLLTYLSETNQLEVSMQDGAWGKWLESVGGAKPEAENQYVAVFTNVQADQSTDADAQSYTVGALKLVYAGKGISDLSVESGTVLYFEVQSF